MVSALWPAPSAGSSDGPYSNGVSCEWRNAPPVSGKLWYVLDGTVAEDGADFWVGVVVLAGAGWIGGGPVVCLKIGS